MGKVKRKKYDKDYVEVYVSIPYGKGKAYKMTISIFIKEKYQFPMGKVKLILTVLSSLESIVSIPYGKGKEQHFVLRFYYNP